MSKHKISKQRKYFENVSEKSKKVQKKISIFAYFIYI